MPDSTLWILLGVCGLGILLVGLIIFVAFAVLRFSGGGILGLFNVFSRGAKEDKETVVIAQSPRPDLRAMAQSESFDTALTNQLVQHDTGAQYAIPPLQPPTQYGSAPTAWSQTASGYNPVSPSPMGVPPALPGYQTPIPPLPPYEPPTHRRSLPDSPAPRRSDYEGDDLDVGAFLDE